MKEKDRNDFQRKEEQTLKDEIQRRIAFAEEIWIRAGEVGLKTLIEAIGSGEYWEIQRLLAEVNNVGASFKVVESGSGRDRVVFGRAEVLSQPFIYEECSGFRLRWLEEAKKNKVGVESLEVSWTGTGYVYLAQVSRPKETRLDGGAIEVKTRLDNVGEVERITFEVELTKQEINVPGAFLRMSTKRSGEIVRGLQVTHAPPA